MKLVLLALAIIGYCFDINSGCCCKKKNDGNGGGGPGKSTPSGTDKFDADINVGPDDVTIKPVGGSEIKLNDGNKVDLNINKLVDDSYLKSTVAYKFNYSKMIKNAKITVDNEIKKKPYLIAIVSLEGDESSKYILIVSKDDGDMSNLFYNINITEVSLLSSDGITDMSGMFSQCVGLSVCNVNIDTSKVTEMAGMFCRCEKLETLDLSCFNTSEVVSMNKMFEGCKKLKNINFGNNFKSDKISLLSYMFSGCAVLSKLDFKNFDICKIAQDQLTGMLINCNSLNEIVLCGADGNFANTLSKAGFTTVDNKTWKKSTK